MRELLAALLLPPGDFLFLGAVGFFLLARQRRLGQTLIALSFLGLYVLSVPMVGKLLLKAVSLPNEVSSEAQAIVVLSAGLREEAREFAASAPDAFTLERLRFAAALERRTHLPIAVSGGTLPGNKANLARVMAEALHTDYGVSTRWIEDRSQTTAENAAFTAAMLKADGIHSIYLVTHSWHMARAKLAFERAGLKVYPAGTVFPTLGGDDVFNPMPSANALNNSYYGLHEILGYVWYYVTIRTEKGTN